MAHADRVPRLVPGVRRHRYTPTDASTVVVARSLLCVRMLNQKVRYGLVRHLVQLHRHDAICEVGSGRTGLARYFPGIRFVGVDLEFTDYGAAAAPITGELRAVVANARALPFRDGAFDLVLSLDMIEHVSAADRRAVVCELARITREDLVVAFPCGEAARGADLREASALTSRGRDVPGWLVEHLTGAYPLPGEMDAVFAGLRRPVRVFGNETALLRRVVRAIEWTGRPERLLDRFLPFVVLEALDAVGGATMRRAYHVRMT